MAGGFSDAQRLAFGHVAEQYERARPSYPAEMIDALMELAGLAAGDIVVEVGAGTGKATRLLAERGLVVRALEPDPAMARLARAATAGQPLVQVEQSDFESWQPGGERAAAAVISAQAWHWVDPDIRYQRAAEALHDGGAIAAIWTFPVWERIRLCEQLREAYLRAAPELAADFPMHPASSPFELAGDWSAEIDASAGFAEPLTRAFEWVQSYSTAAYLELIGTHQDHILLERERAEPLAAAVAAVIDGAGAMIELSFRTQLCLARRLA